MINKIKNIKTEKINSVENDNELYQKYYEEGKQIGIDAVTQFLNQHLEFDIPIEITNPKVNVIQKYYYRKKKISYVKDHQEKRTLL